MKFTAHALAALPLLVAIHVAAAATPLTVEPIVTAGLVRPVGVFGPPGDPSRLMVLEKRGVVRVIDLPSKTLRVTPFLDIDNLIGGGTSSNTETGLLGLAFSPDYANDLTFYVAYTNNSLDTVLARYQRSADANIADPNSAQIVATISQPQDNHNGGWIEFSPRDGYLYWAIGDGGGGGDTGTGHTPGVGNGQDITDNLLGAVLRLDVSGGVAGYAIPTSNPFVGVVGDDEIWAFGLRNPWRNAFDRLTHDLWLADVGQSAREEINFQPAGSLGGENYGWRCREGDIDYDTSGDCSLIPFTEPIFVYPHGAGCDSLTGGRIYRGCAIPDLRGTYFFGDYCSGEIWSLRYDGSTVTEFTDRTAALNPTGDSFNLVSFGEDAAGEVYLVGQSTGDIERIVAAAPADPPTPNDYDNNGAIELFDAHGLLNCISGPGSAYDDCQCDVFDSDGDGDVDLRGTAALQAALGT